MAKRNTTIADMLREAFRASGISALALSKETGISQTRLSAFLRGADIRLITAQKLIDYFGIKVMFCK